jgi:adenylate cyclase
MATWSCPACGGNNEAGTRFCGHCGIPREAGPGLAAGPDSEGVVADALRSFVAGQVADRLVEEGGHFPEERRLITALFADISGFTALAERLGDPEQLMEVIDPVVTSLSSIVGRYEGYVEKFAGDALLALFGAPVSHEDDADRALLVALEMHRELEQICADLPHNPELTLHVGVNSGHGIARILGSEARMDYAVLGDSIILAQRLESAAPPGETYVSSSTLALTRDRFEFEHVGELVLKGKSEPVPTWRLVGERTSAKAAARRLIGRGTELAAVEASLEALAVGRGAVLSVTGEPGVGKSRLTQEVRARAEGRARWLQVRCLSYGSALAYWPYMDLLRRVIGIRAEEGSHGAERSLYEAISDEQVRPYFARLLGLPSGDADVAGLEPEAFRRGLHEGFAAWLTALADEAPVVVALEDLHWADASSVALTADLVSSTAERPVLLYLIARPEAEQLLDELAPQRTAIRLAQLSEEGIEALTESVLDGLPPRDLIPFVVRRTAGNPFFVEELLHSLQDSGALVRVDTNWLMKPGWDARSLPMTIEEVLSARIDLLPRPAATLLQTASVIGRRVPLPLLGAVAGNGSLDQALQELVAGGLLDRGADGGIDMVVFHHALVQDVAYSRLLRRRRRELHRKVATVAEELYGADEEVVDLLARHLYLGEAGDRAVEYLRRAGDRSKRLYANQEAILHFKRAAELMPGDPEIRLELADLYELVGDYEEALRLYEDERRETNDVRAWGGLASTHRKRGEYAQALDVVELAFRSEGLKGEDLTPLWLEQAWTLSVAGRFEQAIDVLEAGLAAKPRRRDSVIGHMLLQLARAETIEGHFDVALSHGLKAQDIFDGLEDLRGLCTAKRIVGDTYRRLERLDEAADALRAGLELAERVGNAEEIGGCLLNLALVEMQRDSLQQAIACNRRAIEEFERIGNASGRAQGYANLAWLLFETSERAEALLYCERALELARTIGNSLTMADVQDTMATISFTDGDLSRAVEQAEQAAALYLEMGALPQAAGSLELAAKAWELGGDAERARAARTRAREVASNAA